MELLLEMVSKIISNWYPVLWLASAGVALVVRVWASRRKDRLDMNHAAKLILDRRYRNDQMSHKEYERRSESLQP